MIVSRGAFSKKKLIKKYNPIISVLEDINEKDNLRDHSS